MRRKVLLRMERRNDSARVFISLRYSFKALSEVFFSLQLRERHGKERCVNGAGEARALATRRVLVAGRVRRYPTF